LVHFFDDLPMYVLTPGNASSLLRPTSRQSAYVPII
jgi:hypothetical protein